MRRFSLTLLLLLACTTTVLSQTKTEDSAAWRSPQTACSLLKDVPGLQTRGWKNDPSRPKDYWSSSPYLNIGDDWPLANNLAFYVNGEQGLANQLKLVLNVNSPSTSERAHKLLALVGELLTRAGPRVKAAG